LPSALTCLGKNVILANSSLTKVISHVIEPFAVSEETFLCGSYDFDAQQVVLAPLEATLYVPYGCKAAYESAPYWNTFKEIMELPREKGDANGDGKTDITDAFCLINYLVGKGDVNFNDEAFDVNGDGVIDIADAVKIINLVAGK
jgi:hypothetical protein